MNGQHPSNRKYFDTFLAHAYATHKSFFLSCFPCGVRNKDSWSWLLAQMQDTIFDMDRTSLFFLIDRSTPCVTK